MKTSNKLLIIVGFLLVAVTIVNAVVIKAEFKKLTDNHVAPETFPLDTISEVEITGTAPRGMNLRVNVSYDEETAVQHTRHDFIHLANEGGKLLIRVDHPKGYRSNIHQVPEITIRCPRLRRISMDGMPLERLDLPDDAHALTRQYYSKSTVKVAGYHVDKLYLYAAKGAEITLSDSKVDSLEAHAGEWGKLVIHGGNSTIGYADLQADKQGKVEVDGSNISTLKTRIDLAGELLMKGTDWVLERNKSDN